MTIAACYFSPEAVILGADSATTTISLVQQQTQVIRHFNHAQKLFAVGDRDKATLGVVTWGLAEVAGKSHRTIVSLLDHDLCSRQINSVADAADALIRIVWPQYETCSPQIALARTLASIPNKPLELENQLRELKTMLTLGYCIGGTWWKDNTPFAYEIVFEPTLLAPPVPRHLTSGHFKFWGCPNMIDRVLYGIDGGLLETIRQHAGWKGGDAALDSMVAAGFLSPPDHVPLREAIDFVHAAIYTTIRAFKFSRLPMLCGGPIEIGVVTSDRPFRWVKHKRLDEAIL